MSFGFVDEQSADEFYGELGDLLDRYRSRMAGPSDEEIQDQILDGYDPTMPGVRTGVIMMVTEAKIDGQWHSAWRSYSPGTGMWAARGMAHDFLEWCTEA